MKKHEKFGAAAAVAALLAGCGTTPKHDLSRGNPASSVHVVDAPPGAVVQAGQLAVRADGEGEAHLVLEDGWHELYVFDGTTKIYEERVFLQDGSRKLVDLKP